MPSLQHKALFYLYVIVTPSKWKIWLETCLNFTFGLLLFMQKKYVLQVELGIV